MANRRNVFFFCILFYKNASLSRETQCCYVWGTCALWRGFILGAVCFLCRGEQHWSGERPVLCLQQIQTEVMLSGTSPAEECLKEKPSKENGPRPGSHPVLPGRGLFFSLIWQGTIVTQRNIEYWCSEQLPSLSLAHLEVLTATKFTRICSCSISKENTESQDALVCAVPESLHPGSAVPLASCSAQQCCSLPHTEAA